MSAIGIIGRDDSGTLIVPTAICCRSQPEELLDAFDWNLKNSEKLYIHLDDRNIHDGHDFSINLDGIKRWYDRTYVVMKLEVISKGYALKKEGNYLSRDKRAIEELLQIINSNQFSYARDVALVFVNFYGSI